MKQAKSHYDRGETSDEWKPTASAVWARYRHGERPILSLITWMQLQLWPDGVGWDPSSFYEALTVDERRWFAVELACEAQHWSPAVEAFEEHRPFPAGYFDGASCTHPDVDRKLLAGFIAAVGHAARTAGA